MTRDILWFLTVALCILAEMRVMRREFVIAGFTVAVAVVCGIEAWRLM